VNQKIVSLLNRVLKTSGRKLKKTNEYMFWSPFIAHHKPKLQINIQTGKWHCWVSNEGGHNLFQLFKKAKATHDQMDELSKLVGKPNYRRDDSETTKKQVVKLPRDFKSMYEKSNSPVYKQAMMYLLKRGVTGNDILKYNIGYCEEGAYRNRVIIPSYDKNGSLNYFVGRDVYNSKLKYKNPPVSKDVIGFELFINWDEPLILCEGVFDAIAIKRNAIPLFGKTVQSKLKTELYLQSVKKIYVVLDEDAKKDALKLTSKLMENGIEVYFVHMRDKDPSDIGFERMLHKIKNTRRMNLKSFLANKLFKKKKKFIDI
jgi:DNA primase